MDRKIELECLPDAVYPSKTQPRLLFIESSPQRLIAIDSLSVTGINQYAAQRNHGVMNDAARGIPQTKTFYMLIQMFLCLISL